MISSFNPVMSFYTPLKVSVIFLFFGVIKLHNELKWFNWKKDLRNWLASQEYSLLVFQETVTNQIWT